MADPSTHYQPAADFVWTDELQKKFAEIVKNLDDDDLENAAKTIELVNNGDNRTRQLIASHLKHFKRLDALGKSRYRGQKTSFYSADPLEQSRRDELFRNTVERLRNSVKTTPSYSSIRNYTSNGNGGGAATEDLD